MIVSSSISTLIPQASTVDYTDICNISGYKILLLKLYEKSGGLCFPTKKVTSRMRDIERQSVSFNSKLSQIIDSSPLSWIDTLLDCYGISFRLGYRRMPDNDFSQYHRLKAVNQWLCGDNSISANEAALLLAPVVSSSNNISIDSRYHTFYSRMLDCWLGSLGRSGTIADASPSEIFRIIKHIISIDLCAYVGSRENQSKIKQQWVNSVLGVDPSSLDTDTLIEYISFVNLASNFSLVDPDDRIKLLYVLVGRADTDSFLRQTIELELEDRESND